MDNGDMQMEISVIMPVYGVEEYVRKAIESVLNQTFTDFEFFAIDDGSKDNSGKICDEIASKDSRLKVIHQENRGSSAARNAGLQNARGKYVYFIDADDWIEEDFLEQLYYLAEKNKADLVITGFSMEYYTDGKDVTYTTPCPDRKYDSIGEFRKDAYHYFNNSLLSLPWNKLFLREEIEKNNIRFMKTKWPDHHFCMDYLMDCKNVVLSSMTKYHWYRSKKDASTMIIYADPNMYKKRVEHFQHILRLYQHWGINDEDSMGGICSYYVGRLVQCVQEIVDNGDMNGAEKKARIKNIVNDKMTIGAFKHARSLSKMMKIMSWPLKAKNVTLCIAFSKLINTVRKRLPGLFIKLKEKEVHGA